MEHKIALFGKLKDEVVEVLALGEFPVWDKERFGKFLDATSHDRVLAMLEYPSIDIELEIYTADGYEPQYATATDNSIALSYYICIKGLYHGTETWMSDDYAGDCYVDFNDPNWRELLEQEMDDRLREYAELHDYSLTGCNFVE